MVIDSFNIRTTRLKNIEALQDVGHLHMCDMVKFTEACLIRDAGIQQCKVH